MTAVERVLQALGDQGKTVQQRGGQYEAQCPVHDDERPSLGVRPVAGKVLLNCRVGCATKDVAGALGLTLSDLFDEQQHKGRPVVVAEYPYTDENGTVLFVKERRAPKDFRVKRPDGHSGWSFKLGNARRVLYRLPDVLAAVRDGRTVYVVEGEKDADRLAALGHVATCNFDGAAKDGQRPKWRSEYGDVLTGADVIVIADRDEAGRAHARAIVADLQGKAKSVSVVQARVEAEHADVSDHLAAGYRVDELAPLPVRVAVVEDQDEEEEATLLAAPEFPHKLARGPLRDLMDWADADGLPVSFVGAGGEVAAASAASGRPGADPSKRDLGARLQLTATRRVLPVLWAALIAGSGAGKNPSMNAALTPIIDYYEALMADWEDRREQEKDDPPPRPQALIQSSVGIEAIARWLSKTGGSGLIRNGELASFLKGLGQYKAGGGSDRYDAMDIWSGEPLNVERVGHGGAKNEIQIYVPRPRLSIIGGLVTENVRLLGSESDGLRARFLPVLPSSQVIPNLDGSNALPSSWTESITTLLEWGEAREWLLRGDVREVFRDAMHAWKNREMNGSDPVVVKTALAKADEQCLRIALAAAESATPCQGGDIPLWAMEYAIARVEYSLGCWMSLGSDQVMAFSRKDEVLHAGVAELLRAIEARSPGPDGRRHMTRREIQRSQIAGAVKPALVDELIRAYLSAYPGCVTVYSDKDLAKFPRARLADRSTAPSGNSRGPAPAVVYAPRRHAHATLSRVGGTAEKLSDPTVSTRYPHGGPHEEPARHNDAATSQGSSILSGDPPPDSFRPTVSPAPHRTPEGDRSDGDASFMADSDDEIGEWSA